ncbi:MAG: transposase [Patescibacteria group bacterium]
MRKVPFIVGQFYHIYNRGVDKRDVFNDGQDAARFLESMKEFNVEEPIGSLYEIKYERKFGHPTFKKAKKKKLVNIVCYCINPNHFHFILEEIIEGGISEFLKRLGGGYTKYFNERNKRSGSLFQGRFKSVHIDTNAYLLHVSAYVNLNNWVHRLGNTFFGRWTSKKRSSWGEYVGDNPHNPHSAESDSLCTKEIILGQFKNKREYEAFAKEAVGGIIERRYGEEVPGLDSLLLE